MEEGESGVYSEVEASLDYINLGLKNKQKFKVSIGTLRKIT